MNYKDVKKLNCDIHLEILRKGRLTELEQLQPDEENDQIIEGKIK